MPNRKKLKNTLEEIWTVFNRGNIAIALTIAIGVIGFAFNYISLMEVANILGVVGWRAMVWPLLVDATMAVMHIVAFDLETKGVKSSTATNYMRITVGLSCLFSLANAGWGFVWPTSFGLLIDNVWPSLELVFWVVAPLGLYQSTKVVSIMEKTRLNGKVLVSQELVELRIKIDEYEATVKNQQDKISLLEKFETECNRAQSELEASVILSDELEAELKSVQRIHRDWEGFFSDVGKSRIDAVKRLFPETTIETLADLAEVSTSYVYGLNKKGGSNGNGKQVKQAK